MEEQAKALFKSWFIDFEPFKGGKFVDSELGKIPEGWNMVSFETFISESQDKVIVGTYPAYSVTNNGITPRTEKFKKQLSKATSKEKILRKDDLVFGMSRQILNWGIMQDEIGGVSSAYHVYKIDKERVVPTYLRYFIKESTFKSQRAFNLQVLVTKQVIDWVYEVHSTRSIGIICILEFQIESILRCTSVLRHFFKGTH